MENKILVTGATGNVGSEVIKELKRNNIALKAADIQNLKEKLGENTEFVHYNFEKPETYQKAYRNVKKLFLIRPPAMEEFKDSIFPALDAAKDAGVEHVVFLSMVGVNKRVPHYKIEKYIEKMGIGYTFLRASFFMQNLSTIHKDVIKDKSDLLIPAGKGQISFIDIRDIAAVAAKVLMDTSGVYINKTLNLTGDKAINFYEISEMMTEVLGKPITYSNPKPKEFTKIMLSYGFPKDAVKVMKMIYFIVRLGKAKDLYDTTEEILGRKPISMEQYIRDYAESWQ